MARKFKQHGTLLVSVDGRIVHLRGKGPWNAESLQLTEARLMQQIQAMYGSPWAVLANFEGEAVYVPEAFALLRKQVQKEIRLGRVATAIVFENVNSPKLSRHQFNALYQMDGHEVAFFDGREDAREWLDSVIKQHQQNM
ncbi:hypothetical protein [Alteromonas gilva]|uniref:STAS/SEC14 domain-containing protein n=1 Tax=Alteromonas gilva TaxID=2987522 RepID=A0ABT5L680_9ALTE|nr:hypothetical protein [Alteromonas gilva]MDC8832557.1 hypothetical protein [Alteromonas gilva]